MRLKQGRSSHDRSSLGLQMDSRTSPSCERAFNQGRPRAAREAVCPDFFSAREGRFEYTFSSIAANGVSQAHLRPLWRLICFSCSRELTEECTEWNSNWANSECDAKRRGRVRNCIREILAVAPHGQLSSGDTLTSHVATRHMVTSHIHMATRHMVSSAPRKVKQIKCDTIPTRFDTEDRSSVGRG